MKRPLKYEGLLHLGCREEWTQRRRHCLGMAEAVSGAKLRLENPALINLIGGDQIAVTQVASGRST
jgi:hypothetical protein